jgi:8-oxo-dGTP pyrophosphatase MutT (NUDIX family)
MPAWATRDLSVLGDMDAILDTLHRHSRQERDVTMTMSAEWVATSRPSAVLIPLLVDAGVPSVVLTRRADHLKNHRGEISFPGGRTEGDETAHQTALREAHEEVALSPDLVRVIGTLDPIATYVSNSHITPVIAHVTGEPVLRADAGEVARVFTVPLAELAHADTYRNEWWTTPRGEVQIHFFELVDETVWGATGRVLNQLLDVITVG